jgi:amidase
VFVNTLLVAMATLTAASESHKQRISAQDVQDAAKSIGVSLKPEQVKEWHEIIASVQESIDIVDSLPDYFPEVDTTTFPRLHVHRPAPEENEGNAWAWRATIEGRKEGPLAGISFCLKDNITVKDVPMLLGTDMFTDYVPKTDASKSNVLLEAYGFPLLTVLSYCIKDPRSGW